MKIIQAICEECNCIATPKQLLNYLRIRKNGLPTPEIENEVKAEYPGVITYLPHEIRELSRLKPEEVKKAHMAKKMFNGQFVKSTKTFDKIRNDNPKI